MKFILVFFVLSFIKIVSASYSDKCAQYLISSGVPPYIYSYLPYLSFESIKCLRNPAANHAAHLDLNPLLSGYGAIIAANYPPGHKIYKDLYKLHPDSSKTPRHWEALVDYLKTDEPAPAAAAAAAAAAEPGTHWANAIRVAQAVRTGAEADIALLPVAMHPAIARLCSKADLAASYVACSDDEAELKDQDDDRVVQRAVVQVGAATRALAHLQVGDVRGLPPQVLAFVGAVAQRLEVGTRGPLLEGQDPLTVVVTPRETTASPELDAALMGDGRPIGHAVLTRIAAPIAAGAGAAVAGAPVEPLMEAICVTRRANIAPAVRALMPVAMHGRVDAMLAAIVTPATPLADDLRTGGRLTRLLRSYISSDVLRMCAPTARAAIAGLMIPDVDAMPTDVLPAGTLAPMTAADALQEHKIRTQTDQLKEDRPHWSHDFARTVATHMHAGDDLATAYIGARGDRVMCDDVDISDAVAAHVGAHPERTDADADAAVRRLHRARTLVGRVHADVVDAVAGHMDHTVPGTAADLEVRIMRATCDYVRTNVGVFVPAHLRDVLGERERTIVGDICQNIERMDRRESTSRALAKRFVAPRLHDHHRGAFAESVARRLLGGAEGGDLDALIRNALVAELGAILCDSAEVADAVADRMLAGTPRVESTRLARIAHRHAALRRGQLAGEDAHLDAWARIIAEHATGGAGEGQAVADFSAAVVRAGLELEEAHDLRVFSLPVTVPTLARMFASEVSYQDAVAAVRDERIDTTHQDLAEDWTAITRDQTEAYLTWIAKNHPDVLDDGDDLVPRAAGAAAASAAASARGGVPPLADTLIGKFLIAQLGDEGLAQETVTKLFAGEEVAFDASVASTTWEALSSVLRKNYDFPEQHGIPELKVVRLTAPQMERARAAFDGTCEVLPWLANFDLPKWQQKSAVMAVRASDDDEDDDDPSEEELSALPEVLTGAITDCSTHADMRASLAYGAMVARDSLAPVTTADLSRALDMDSYKKDESNRLPQLFVDWLGRVQYDEVSMSLTLNASPLLPYLLVDRVDRKEKLAHVGQSFRWWMGRKLTERIPRRFTPVLLPADAEISAHLARALERAEEVKTGAGNAIEVFKDLGQQAHIENSALQPGNPVQLMRFLSASSEVLKSQERKSGWSPVLIPRIEMCEGLDTPNAMEEAFPDAISEADFLTACGSIYKIFTENIDRPSAFVTRNISYLFQNSIRDSSTELECRRVVARLQGVCPHGLRVYIEDAPTFYVGAYRAKRDELRKILCYMERGLKPIADELRTLRALGHPSGAQVARIRELEEKIRPHMLAAENTLDVLHACPDGTVQAMASIYPPQDGGVLTFAQRIRRVMTDAVKASSTLGVMGGIPEATPNALREDLLMRFVGATPGYLKDSPVNAMAYPHEAIANGDHTLVGIAKVHGVQELGVALAAIRWGEYAHGAIDQFGAILERVRWDEARPAAPVPGRIYRDDVQELLRIIPGLRGAPVEDLASDDGHDARDLLMIAAAHLGLIRGGEFDDTLVPTKVEYSRRTVGGYGRERDSVRVCGRVTRLESVHPSLELCQAIDQFAAEELAGAAFLPEAVEAESADTRALRRLRSSALVRPGAQLFVTGYERFHDFSIDGGVLGLKPTFGNKLPTADATSLSSVVAYCIEKSNREKFFCSRDEPRDFYGDINPEGNKPRYYIWRYVFFRALAALDKTDIGGTLAGSILEPSVIGVAATAAAPLAWRTLARLSDPKHHVPRKADESDHVYKARVSIDTALGRLWMRVAAQSSSKLGEMGFGVRADSAQSCLDALRDTLRASVGDDSEFHRRAWREGLQIASPEERWRAEMLAASGHRDQGAWHVSLGINTIDSDALLGRMRPDLPAAAAAWGANDDDWGVAAAGDAQPAAAAAAHDAPINHRAHAAVADSSRQGWPDRPPHGLPAMGNDAAAHGAAQPAAAAAWEAAQPAVAGMGVAAADIDQGALAAAMAAGLGDGGLAADDEAVAQMIAAGLFDEEVDPHHH